MIDTRLICQYGVDTSAEGYGRLPSKDMHGICFLQSYQVSVITSKPSDSGVRHARLHVGIASIATRVSNNLTDLYIATIIDL